MRGVRAERHPRASRRDAAPAAAAVVAALATLALGGCGGGGEETATSPSPAPTTEAAPPRATSAPEQEKTEPRPRSRSLTGCLRAAPGVDEVLEKGPDSEDARYFEDLVGERPRILAITVAGESAEIDAFVFASKTAARKAAPAAGGAALKASAHGRAVLVAPPSADTTVLESCLVG